MKYLLGIICLLLKFLGFTCEILCVIEINRHGARTSNGFPVETNKLFFGTKDMQLTINGFRQEQILGEFVKSKYISNKHFLKKKYDSNEFQLVSSPTQRTIFSAAGFLSGIYPDHIVKMNYEENNNLKVDDTIPIADNLMYIKEIQIKVIDNQKDSLFHPLKCMYKGKLLMQHLMKNSTNIFPLTEQEIETSLLELKNVLGLSDEELGKSGIDMENLQKSFDKITKYYSPYMYHFNNNLNSKLRKETLSTVKKYTLNRLYSMRLNDNIYRKLSSSEILDNILNIFNQSIDAYKNKKKYLKYMVYSGHDTVFVNILSNLLRKSYLKKQINAALNDNNSYKFLVPPFASNMFFELHLDHSGDLFVEILYNGKYLNNGLKDLKTEDIINNRIQYKKFVEILSSSIDKDYKNLDCSVNSIDKKK